MATKINLSLRDSTLYSRSQRQTWFIPLGLRSMIVMLSFVLMGTSLVRNLSAQTASKQSQSASAQVPPRPGVVGQREETKPRKCGYRDYYLTLGAVEAPARPSCKPWETVMVGEGCPGTVYHWCETDGNKGFPSGPDIIEAALRGEDEFEVNYWKVSLLDCVSLYGDIALRTCRVVLNNVNKIRPYRDTYEYELFICNGCGDKWMTVELRNSAKQEE